MPTTEARRDRWITSAVLSSIQVGLPHQFGNEAATDPMDRPWTTGFCKEPVVGPVWLRTLNLDGDGQADLVHHGGPDKAVLAYSLSHYAGWQQELCRQFPPGSFGENFTVDGHSEEDICIGDIWRVGETALVQVSQPRQPCWKLARRWRIKTLALQVQETGRTGWYFRVLREGEVAAGEPLTLVERRHPHWSVKRANHIMHRDKTDLSSARELAALPSLSANWKQTLERRVMQHIEPDSAKRLIGENDG